MASNDITPIPYMVKINWLVKSWKGENMQTPWWSSKFTFFTEKRKDDTSRTPKWQTKFSALHHLSEIFSTLMSPRRASRELQAERRKCWVSVPQLRALRFGIIHGRDSAPSSSLQKCLVKVTLYVFYPECYNQTGFWCKIWRLKKRKKNFKES
jgi:hypothetical protein